MTALAAGMDYVDLCFLGKPGIIATAILQGSSGVALIDPGPSTTLATLTSDLAAKGIAKERITTRGYGESQPLVSLASEQARETNRRVEIRLLQNKGIRGE